MLDRLLIAIFFLILKVVVAQAQEVTDARSLERKIKAFDEFEASKKAYELDRDKDLNIVLEERARDKKAREKELAEYLLEKAKEKKIKPEDTPAYETYLLQKWQWQHDLEKSAEVEIREKVSFRRNKKALEFEIREYGLQDSEKNRVPQKQRKLLSSSKGTGGSGGGGGSFGGGGSYPFIPPPPIEDVPDFDNEIPPPPPPPPPSMPNGGADFEEVEPVPIPPPPPIE